MNRKIRRAALGCLSLLLLCGVSFAFGQDSDAAASLSFRPDRHSAEQIKQQVIVRVAQQNRQAAALLEKALERKDVSALFEQAAAPFGLHDGNLADAITARDIMKQMRETHSPAPSAEQVRQQRNNTAISLAAQSGARLETKRRELAEVAQLGFVLDYLAWSQAKNDVSATPNAAAPVPQENDGTREQPLPEATQQPGAFVEPIGSATLSGGSFTLMGSTFHVDAWYLYAGGIATNCSAHDPETLQISLPALRSMRDCTGARWRRSGNTVQIQASDRDPWRDARAQPAQPAGTHLQFLGETAGGAGTMPGGAGISVNTVDSGRLVLTADGHIRTALSSATAIGGAGVGGGASSARRFEGTYSISGYVMTLTAPNGQNMRRLVTIVREGGETYVYFQGREYWPPRGN